MPALKYAYGLEVEFCAASKVCVGAERRNDATSQYSYIHLWATDAPYSMVERIWDQMLS